jgi:hypothetical protein
MDALPLLDGSLESPYPFASLYHFFPAGKQELAVEAVRRSGHQYAQFVAAVLSETDDTAEAMHIAVMFLMTLERAFLLARTARDTSALEIAGERMPHLLRQALAGRGE